MPGINKTASNNKKMMQTGIGFISGTVVSLLFQPLEVFKMAIILSPKIKGGVWSNVKGYSNIITK